MISLRTAPAVTETQLNGTAAGLKIPQVTPRAIVTPGGFYVWWQNGPAAWIDVSGTITPTPGIGWFHPTHGDIVDDGAGSLLAWSWSVETLELWWTDPWASRWTRLARERRWQRYDPGLPVVEGNIDRQVDDVTVLHPEADGTLTFARDGGGFAWLRNARVIDAGDAGGYSGVSLVSAVDGLYATGWVFADGRPLADVRRVGDPTWRSDLPRWLAAANPWWDADASGHLRATVRRNAALISLTFGKRAAWSHVRIPPLPPDHAPGLVAQAPDRLFVDGAAFYAAVDARMLKAGMLRTELAPRPVPGASRVVFDPWSKRNYELSGDATSWYSPGLPVRDNLTVDGCGRSWTLRPPSYTLDGAAVGGRHGWAVTVTDASGQHDVGPLPAISDWTQVIGRPEGIAIGGSSLVHDVHLACPRQ